MASDLKHGETHGGKNLPKAKEDERGKKLKMRNRLHIASKI
jgi:hypothetical protein